MTQQNITGQVLIDTNTGEIMLRTSSGTFEDGAPVLKQLGAMLRARGAVIAGELVPEQHRHDDPSSHEHEKHHA